MLDVRAVEEAVNASWFDRWLPRAAAVGELGERGMMSPSDWGRPRGTKAPPELLEGAEESIIRLQEEKSRDCEQQERSPPRLPVSSARWKGTLSESWWAKVRVSVNITKTLRCLLRECVCVRVRDTQGDLSHGSAVTFI